MNQRITPIWLWLCVLLLCFLSTGVLLAQDDLEESPAEPDPLLFAGTLNDGNATEGNNITFTIAINAGDQITATSLCEMADDGLRLIDPALTVYAPQGEDSLERLQWYNDDSDAVTDCVDYRSSQVVFEAPVTGDYEFLIENLAGRSGPFTLEILGSTAIQTQLDIAPEELDEDALVEEGADEQEELVALDASTEEDEENTEAATVENQQLVYLGLFAAKDDVVNAMRSYEVTINAGDEVVAELTCQESFGSRWLDPNLTITFTNENDEVSTWENDDHEEAAECLSYRSSRVVFTAPETGTYTVAAENLSFYKGNYLLSISGVTAPQTSIETFAPLWDGTSDPPGALTTFDGELAVKGEATHTIQLEEGERVAALAICEAVDDLRPMDPVLRILDPDGMLLLRVDDSLDYQTCASWYSSYAEFIAATSGEYSFIVSNVAQESSGPYTLAVVRPALSARASAVADGGGGGETSVSSRDSRIGSLGEIGSVYLVNSDKGPRLDIYAIDSSSSGQHVLSIYGDQLGSAPGSDRLLASARGGSYSAYHLSDGTLRLSAGPNDRGKLYHMILDGVPGNVLSTYDEVLTAGSVSASAAPAASEDTSSPTINILTTHVVQPGETLYSIGVLYGVGYEVIAAANNIDSNFIIHVGAELVIPAP